MATPDLISDDVLKRELLEADVALRRSQVRWEVPKAIAALAAAGAIFFGFALAAANWLHPSPQQIVATVHLDQPVVVKGQ